MKKNTSSIYLGLKCKTVLSSKGSSMLIETSEKKPLLHVLVCTRTKENGESCGAKGAAALRDELKKWVKGEKLNPDIKVTASLCLGFCEQGITMCFQPTNQWFVKINAKQDVADVKKKILESYQEIKG